MKNDLVKQGYNKAAEDYTSDRDQSQNVHYLEELESHLKAHTTILDLGCGAGLPIDRFFIEKGYKITGIDISEKQIELAEKNVPQAAFEVKDMSELKEGDYSVDVVVSFYAIFHTPREQHADLFKKVNSFLPKGGYILVTMGAGEYEGLEDNFHGTQMWWSHYGSEKNTEIVKNAGFEIILDEIDDNGNERHQVIMARKS